MAVWDPSQFNNVRVTMARQWELYQPEIRVANSVSGVNQYFEISKRSHATLTSNGPESTRVEVYPTFAIRIGCNFDYSGYPYDTQKCALRLYTTNTMAEVELSNYYNLNPSINLGWGQQSNKRQISDWYLVQMTSNMSYYRNRAYTDERPRTSKEYEVTWSIALTWIEMQRRSGLFWATLALPALLASLFNAFSFLMAKPEHSVFLVVLNLLVQAIFLQDILKELPPVVGSPVRIVHYMVALLTLTTFAIILHLCSKKIAAQYQRIPPAYKQRVETVMQHIGPRPGSPAYEKHGNGDDSAENSIPLVTIRNALCIVYLALSLLLSLIYLV